MKKFWLGAVFACISLTGLWLLGVKYQLGVPTASSRWVFDAYQLKIAAANRILGHKILVVAGSNAMFGIDSSQLESAWRMPVVNLGVNAGLGLPYILDTSKQVARPGDLILLPMEYALLLDDGKPNSQIIDYVIARDLKYWHRLPRLEQLRFAFGMSPDRWVEGFRQLPDTPVTSGTYGAHHLNFRGDQTHSGAEDRTAANVAAVLAAKPWNYGERAKNEHGGWEMLASYAKWGHTNHICIIAVPTVLLHHPKYDQNIDDIAFYSQLPHRLTALGIPYLGKPKDFMYPSSWFFDTDHHLQSWARARHTKKILQTIGQAPQKYCPELK